MPYIGIDPGKQGAMVTLFEDGTISFTDLKDLYDETGASKSALNPEKLQLWVTELDETKHWEVWCERPIFVGGGFTIRTPMSMFESYGVFRGVFVSTGMEFHGVAPRVWQKWYPSLYHPKIKRSKEESVAEAKRVFPSYAGVFERVVAKGAHKGNRIIMDGRAEAALIAHYGQNNSGFWKNKN